MVNTDDVHDPFGFIDSAWCSAALWLTCGLLATASAVGLLVLAPAIRRRSHAARLSGGRR